MTIKKIFRDPLSHFLLAGLIVFLASYFFSTDNPMDPDNMTVDQKDMVDYMQFRYGILDAREAKTKFDALNNEKRSELVNDYIQEVVLDKEARSLGFNIDRFAQRGLIADKMKFIIHAAAGEPSLDFKELQEHYEKNKEVFYIQPSISFLQVFFDRTKHPPEMISNIALQKKNELNNLSMSTVDPGAHGDQFPFGNYVENGSYDMVASNFNKDVADNLFALEPAQSLWAGPFESAYGLHLILLTDKKLGRQPEFREILPYVRMHYVEMIKKELLNQEIEKLKKKYNVHVNI